MFSVYIIPSWWLREYIALSYYHHQIGSMNYYPLFRVRSWNNGMRCMSLHILMGKRGNFSFVLFTFYNISKWPSNGRVLKSADSILTLFFVIQPGVVLKLTCVVEHISSPSWHMFCTRRIDWGNFLLNMKTLGVSGMFNNKWCIILLITCKKFFWTPNFNPLSEEAEMIHDN